MAGTLRLNFWRPSLLLVALVAIFLLGTTGEGFGQTLESDLVRALARGINQNFDIKWKARVENKREIVESVLFGIKTDFLQNRLASFPEQVQKEIPLRDRR